MVHTGQAAHWIRYLNEDFILILSSSSPIKPDCSHMLSYSFMHVTSVVRKHLFYAHAWVQCSQRTMFMCCFVSVRSCKSAAFTLEECCQSSGASSHCRCIVICCSSEGTHLQCSTHYYTFAQQQTVIGCSQNAAFSSVQNKQEQLLVWVID